MWKHIYDRAFTDNLKIKNKDMKKRIKKLNSEINYLYIDNETIGFAMMFPIIKNIWHLDYFAIDPKYQSNGYGKILMKQILDKYKNISLECEDHLIKYYNKFNFKKFNINYDYHGHKLNILSHLSNDNNINHKDMINLIIKLNNYNLISLILYNKIMINFFEYNIKLSYDLNKNIEKNYYKHEIF